MSSSIVESFTDLVHAKRIVHRDIKPQNVVMKNDEGQHKVRLIDFGEAVKLPQGLDLLRGSAGTLQFMAPEVGKRVKPDGYDAFKAEVWSFGCLLYSYYYLQPPIWGESLVDLFKAIETGAWRFLEEVRPVPELLKQVITACLTIDADKRPSLQEVSQMEWFTSGISEWVGNGLVS